MTDKERDRYLTDPSYNPKTTKAVDYKTKRDNLIRYLYDKADEGDWHGCSDAANDLRVLEAKENK